MIIEPLTAAGVGFVSALLPVVSAEAFQAGSSLLQRPTMVAVCVVALAIGQTCGKVVIFLASRRGASRWRSHHPGGRSRMPAWVTRANASMLRWLSHPAGGPAAVAVSASVGVPPLAVVRATAGASTIRCFAFCVACFSGSAPSPGVSPPRRHRRAEPARIRERDCSRPFKYASPPA